MTPSASVAILEKLALFKIARCNAPAFSRDSFVSLRSVVSVSICVLVSGPIKTRPTPSPKQRTQFASQYPSTLFSTYFRVVTVLFCSLNETKLPPRGPDRKSRHLTPFLSPSVPKTHDQRPLVQKRRHLLPPRRHLHGR